MSLQAHSRHDAEIAALGPWFHNLHLPDGRVTAPDHPLGDFPAFKWRRIERAIPLDLRGWTALDIGCNAGFYTFELAARGARVTAIEPDGRYLDQARWAAERFEVTGQIEFRQSSVYDLARADESWDLVLFMGVLYHLRYPLLALDIVGRVVGRLLLLQTLTMPGERRIEPPRDLALSERERLTEPGWPHMAFLERRLAGDPSNWWAPNAAAVEAMARSSGLEVLERPAHEVWLCRPDGPFQHDAELAAARGQAPRKRK